MDVDRDLVNEVVGLSTDDAKFEETCLSIANCIKISKYTITQLVQDLGALLTNSAVTEREKGMLILSTILSFMPEDILTSTQLNYICNFYAERLNDHHQVVPAVIKGLTPLARSKNIPEGLSTHLLNSMFQHVPCQQQQQHDRYNIYVFIKTLLDKRKDEMKAMGLELIYGVISAIDSERDPRNLLFLFNWLPNFVKAVELGQLTEEMFDVMSCYFPVDFRPTTQDETTVTRETLANALCPCLCSLPAFAELCIPLALEKLESELRIAKLDSLDLLIEGSKIFPLDSYKQHCSTIWSLIQKEVLGNIHKQDKELEVKCLQGLTLLFSKVSADLEFTREVSKDIIDTLKGNLRPDTLLHVPSWKLVKSLSQASRHTAEIVFKETSPLFINMYSITTTPMHKATILEQLVEITVMYISTNAAITIDDVEDLKLIPNICLKAMADTDPQIRFVGISSLSRLAPFIPLSTRTYFYQHLSPLIIFEQDLIVRNAVLYSLQAYAKLYHKEVQTMLEEVQNNGLESLQKYLEAVGSVVCITELMSFSIAILVEHVFKSYDISAIAVEILKTKLEQDELIISKYLIETEYIIDKVTDYLVDNVDDINVEVHNNFLNNITRMLIIIIRNLNENDQEILITKQIEKVKSLQSNDFTLVILYGLLTSLKPPIRVDFFEIYNITSQTTSSYICNIGSELLASIINKTSDENTLLSYLDYVREKSDTLILSQQHTENVITIICFTTKALVLQSSPLMFTWIEKLIHLSASNVSAAKAFNVILDESHDCLSTKNYCRKRLLYKQKFFVEISNYLMSNYDENNKHYLTILGYLLQNIPQQILRLQLKQIIRLVLLCLSYSEDADVLLAVLSAINAIIKDKEQLAEDYVQEFLKYYLRLAKFEKSMNVRILALRGVQLYSEYPLYKLLPMKQDVLLVLGTCLDDKKRLVRREAVEARSRWFLIDAPI